MNQRGKTLTAMTTLRCQMLQWYTTLPRHCQIGGRCRKWCISTQPTSDKRKCAACCVCGQQFSHGEARFQQWGNRESNNAYFHAHCVDGGVGHDHELHPKQPLDQEAVESVARQRESVIKASGRHRGPPALRPGPGSSLHSFPC